MRAHVGRRVGGCWIGLTFAVRGATQLSPISRTVPGRPAPSKAGKTRSWSAAATDASTKRCRSTSNAGNRLSPELGDAAIHTAFRLIAVRLACPHLMPAPTVPAPNLRLRIVRARQRQTFAAIAPALNNPRQLDVRASFADGDLSDDSGIPPNRPSNACFKKNVHPAMPGAHSFQVVTRGLLRP